MFHFVFNLEIMAYIYACIQVVSLSGVWWEITSLFLESLVFSNHHFCLFHIQFSLKMNLFWSVIEVSCFDVNLVVVQNQFFNVGALFHLKKEIKLNLVFCMPNFS